MVEFVGTTAGGKIGSIAGAWEMVRISQVDSLTS